MWLEGGSRQGKQGSGRKRRGEEQGAGGERRRSEDNWEGRGRARERSLYPLTLTGWGKWTLTARASSAKTRGFHTQLDEGPDPAGLGLATAAAPRCAEEVSPLVSVTGLM